jgi:hypothetical protein
MVPKSQMISFNYLSKVHLLYLERTVKKQMMAYQMLRTRISLNWLDMTKLLE